MRVAKGASVLPNKKKKISTKGIISGGGQKPYILSSEPNQELRNRIGHPGRRKIAGSHLRGGQKEGERPFANAIRRKNHSRMEKTLAHAGVREVQNIGYLSGRGVIY